MTATTTTGTSIHTTFASPVGQLTLVADAGRLTGLYFPHHWYMPDPATFGTRSDHEFGEAKRQLAEYFAGERDRFDLPVDARGDEFQRRVWDLVSQIPYGQTTTYGDLARELSGPAPASGAAPASGKQCWPRTSGRRWAATRCASLFPATAWSGRMAPSPVTPAGWAASGSC